MILPADLAAARRYVRAYARWRCGGDLPLYKGCPPGQTGRGKLDPVYVEETEHRDQKAFWDHYSSCGDLSQGVAWHLGVRTAYVNRKAHKGWASGRNLMHFYDSYLWPNASNAWPAQYAYARVHGVPASRPAPDYAPQAGDLGFIWTPGLNNAHTFVFGSVLQAEDASGKSIVETFNYGAGGMTRTEFPGAHCSKSAVQRRNGLWLGQRKLNYVVPLERLLQDAEGDLLPDMSADSSAELEGRVP